MRILLNLMFAVIPALILVIYFYRRDSQQREPIGLIWKVFVLGFFSVFPAVIIELILESFTLIPGRITGIFFRAFIVAALVEEGIKFCLVRLYVYNKLEFDEITDGIIYTITASMGFACFENILYSSGGLTTVLLRACTAVPLHAVASGIMGYYIGYAKFSGTNVFFKGILAALIIHGLYDFFLFTNSFMAFLIIPLLIAGWKFLKNRFDDALTLDRMSGRS